MSRRYWRLNQSEWSLLLLSCGPDNPKIVSPSRISRPLSKTWFLGPTRVSQPNGIWVASAVFTRPVNVTNRQTDRQTYSCYTCSQLQYCCVSKTGEPRIFRLKLFNDSISNQCRCLHGRIFPGPALHSPMSSSVFFVGSAHYVPNQPGWVAKGEMCPLSRHQRPYGEPLVCNAVLVNIVVIVTFKHQSKDEQE